MNPSEETRAHLTLMAAVAGIVVVLVAGLGLAIHFALTPTTTTSGPNGTPVAPSRLVSKRDLIAAEQMMQADSDDSEYATAVPTAAPCNPH